MMEEPSQKRGRSTADYSPEPTDRHAQFQELIREFSNRGLARLKAGGRCVLVVGQTVTRKRMRSHPADQFIECITNKHPDIQLEQIIEDEIPDVRRSRRSASATKKELILVMRRERATASRHRGRRSA